MQATTRRLNDAPPPGVECDSHSRDKRIPFKPDDLHRQTVHTHRTISQPADLVDGFSTHVQSVPLRQ